MTNNDIASRKRKLDQQFERAKSLPEGEETTSYVAQYLCIQVSGYLENSIKIIYSDFALQKSHPYVANYVSLDLNSFTNANHNKILKVTGKFSDIWEKKLTNDLNEEIKDAIDSLIANRNNIAHGQPVGVTYHKVKYWYEKVQEAVMIINSLTLA